MQPKRAEAPRRTPSLASSCDALLEFALKWSALEEAERELIRGIRYMEGPPGTWTARPEGDLQLEKLRVDERISVGVPKAYVDGLAALNEQARGLAFELAAAAEVVWQLTAASGHEASSLLALLREARDYACHVPPSGERFFLDALLPVVEDLDALRARARVLDGTIGAVTPEEAHGVMYDLRQRLVTQRARAASRSEARNVWRRPPHATAAPRSALEDARAAAPERRPRCSVAFDGEGYPVVRDERLPRKLGHMAEVVVRAMVELFPSRASWHDIQKHLGNDFDHVDVKVIKRLPKSDPRWAKALLFADGPYGGYGIAPW